MGSSSRMERSRVDLKVGRPSSTFGADSDPVEPMKRRGMMNPAPSYALPLFSSLVRRVAPRFYVVGAAPLRSAMNWSNSALSLA
jgi:hypothetical protein